MILGMLAGIQPSCRFPNRAGWRGFVLFAIPFQPKNCYTKLHTIHPKKKQQMKQVEVFAKNGKNPLKGIGIAWCLIATGLSCVIGGILWKSSAAKSEAYLSSQADKHWKEAFQGYTESIRKQHREFVSVYGEASRSKQKAQNYAIGLLFFGAILICCGGWKLSSVILGMKFKANQKGLEQDNNRHEQKNTLQKKQIVYDPNTHQYITR